MAQVLVRDIEDSDLATLKARAERHKRSLESELRELLHGVAEQSRRAWLFQDQLGKLHAQLGAKRVSSSVPILRGLRRER